MSRSISTLLFIIIFNYANVLASTADSVVIEGKKYSIHKVKNGETLYSISNFYRVELAEIVTVNRIGGNGYTLAVSDLLIIPLYAKKENPVVINEKMISPDGYITHIVRQGETLFSISRSYNGVTPQMIKEKNGMESEGVNIGQKLLIPQKLNVDAIYKKPAIAEVEKTPAASDVGSRVAKKESLSLEKQFAQNEKAAGNTEVVRGVAIWTNGNDNEANNYFALHKYAPIGSVIKVRNLMNNKAVFVKVIGKLPESADNRSIIIKLSQAAAKDLGVFDQKFLVEVMLPQV